MILFIFSSLVPSATIYVNAPEHCSCVRYEYPFLSDDDYNEGRRRFAPILEQYSEIIVYMETIVCLKYG